MIIAGSFIATSLYGVFVFLLFVTSNIGHNILSKIFTFYYIGVAPTYFLHYFYVWNIGITMNKNLNNDLRKNTGFFKISMIFVGIYIIVFICGFIYTASHPAPANFFVKIVPFHAVTMILVACNVFFAARSLKTYEKQREVKAEELLFDLFMILLFPVGIFFLQPRINKYVKEFEE